MSVLTLRPNADSTPLELITYPASPTTHYTKIDEASKDESDNNSHYDTSASVTKTDIYGFPDHSSESGTINHVTVKCYCNYQLDGTDKNDCYVNPAVKIGSTVYNGGNQALTTTVSLYSKQWTTNPATSGAWSWTNIDDLLAGTSMVNHVIDKSNLKSPICYQLWVEVDYTEGGGATVKPHYYYLQQ